MALLFIGLGGSACGGREVPLPPGEWQQSDVARERSPAVTAAEKQSLVAGNTAFAFDVYRALCATEDNIVYSPLSISMTMAMLYAGARGGTRDQMASTFHYLLPEPDLHEAFDWLDLTLTARGNNVEGLRFESTNALFLQRGFAVLQPYLDTLARYYGAGVSLMDFASQPERSRQDINAWVRALEIRMPRFGFRTNLDLRDTLRDLGMPIAFTSAADFSGISATPGLQIAFAVHQGFIATSTRQVPRPRQPRPWASAGQHSPSSSSTSRLGWMEHDELFPMSSSRENSGPRRMRSSFCQLPADGQLLGTSRSEEFPLPQCQGLLEIPHGATSAHDIPSHDPTVDPQNRLIGLLVQRPGHG